MLVVRKTFFSGLSGREVGGHLPVTGKLIAAAQENAAFGFIGIVPLRLKHGQPEAPDDEG